MRPKYIFALILAALAAGETLQAQQPNPYRFRGGRYNGFEIEQGDTIISVAVDPLYVFAPPKNMPSRRDSICGRWNRSSTR